MRGSLFFGYGFTMKRSPVGELAFDVSTIVSSTLIVRRRKSMWRGRNAINSPQRIPVSMKVSSIRRYCEGTATTSSSNSSGVSVLDLRAITFGSSVWSHGL